MSMGSNYSDIKNYLFDGRDGNVILSSKDNKYFRCHSQVLSKMCKYFNHIFDSSNRLKIVKFDYPGHIIGYVFKNIYYLIYQNVNQIKGCQLKGIYSHRKFTIEDNLLVLQFLEMLDITNDVEKFRESIINDIINDNTISKLNLLKKINYICKNGKYRKTKRIIIAKLENLDGPIELNSQIINDLDTDLKNKILLILSNKTKLDSSKIEQINGTVSELIKYKEYYEYTHIKIKELKNLTENKRSFHKGRGHYEDVFANQCSIEEIIDQLYNGTQN